MADSESDSVDDAPLNFDFLNDSEDETDALRPSKKSTERQLLQDLYGDTFNDLEDNELDDLRQSEDEDENECPIGAEMAPKALNPPPIDLAWNTGEGLWAYILQWSLDRGYSIRKGRGAKSNSKGPYRFFIECDKAQEAKKSRGNGTRRTGTDGVGCKFKLRAQRCPNDKVKPNCWRLWVIHGHCNHDGSSDPSIHKYHRRLTPEQRAAIATLSKSYLTAAQILDSIRQTWPKILAKPQDIWNERYRQRVTQLKGMTPTQALYSILKDPDKDWVVIHEEDKQGRVIRFFFTHLKILEIARLYPEVQLVDATYGVIHII